MQAAALIHDVGKLLTVFGENDEHVDCMNRLVQLPEPGSGLDSIRYEYNHDDFGFSKVWPYLPARVLDIMRFHSLREIPYAAYDWCNASSPDSKGCVDAERSMAEDPFRVDVTWQQARAFKASLSAGDLERVQFVAHFQWFDARSKSQTEVIPAVDFEEIEAVIHQFFPDGTIVF